MANPLVSVIIPCFNSERYLRSTLNSVLAQTLSDFEIIAVDDCSTDSTPRILAKYAEQDSRIIIIRHEKNSGRPAYSKNTALKAIRGKYVSLLDHDDLFLPDKLRVSVDMLEKYPECVAAFHDIELVDSDGNMLSRYLGSFLDDARDYLEPDESGYFICKGDFYKFQSIRYAALHTISTTICPERIAGDISFDVSYGICDDTDLWVRLGMAGSIAYSPSILASYRQHETNITRDQDKWDRETLLYLQKNRERIKGRLLPAEDAALRRRISDTFANQGWHMRCVGRHGAATRAYLKALLWRPGMAQVFNVVKALFPVRYQA
ncbi:MAG: glycosyltransferase [Azonexus sp.]|jgi:glycosyltransferase involved in cell wall biosynthesis|nr:glycosyltransferase [Azonexus sp.]